MLDNCSSIYSQKNGQNDLKPWPFVAHLPYVSMKMAHIEPAYLKKKTEGGLDASPRWGQWPERGGRGPDMGPFGDANGPNADQTRIRLRRPVGVILTKHMSLAMQGGGSKELRYKLSYSRSF